MRIAHRDFEGGEGRAPTEKVLQPLERQEFENGFIVEFLPFLKDVAGRKHVNAIMEGLACNGLEFLDPKPANIRLLPDEKRTPVIIDGDAVDIGRSAQFRSYAAKVKGKPSEYTWEEGLQNSLFSDLCKKYNLSGQEYSKEVFWDSLQEVVDSIPNSGFLYEVARERKKLEISMSPEEENTAMIFMTPAMMTVATEAVVAAAAIEIGSKLKAVGKA